MFLVRSAFWLTVAFMTVHPQSADLGAAATALSNQALDAGKRVVVGEVMGNDCPLLRCAAPAAVTTTQPTVTAASSRVVFTVQDPPSPGQAPYPMRRPNWIS